ncbi:hypothetical protein FMN50_02485 [Rhodobacterales bacterium]|nr:hypothetical protein FMN50_02485 [Rhodobacterales bacterium]
MTTIAASSSFNPADIGASQTSEKAESRFLNFRDVLKDQYRAWREMPEDERIRHSYLRKHDLSEADLDALSPQEKAAHEAKIAELSNRPVMDTAVDASKGGDTLSSPVLTLRAILEISQPDDETLSTEAVAAKE